MDAFNTINAYNGGGIMESTRIYVIYNTLIESGYLATKREESLDKILE